MIIKYLLGKLKVLKKFLPRRTIRLELIVTLICTALIPVVIVNMYYYNMMNEFTKEKVKAYNIEIIRQVGEKLDSLVSEMEIAKKQTVEFLITSGVFDNYGYKTPMEKIDTIKKTENLLSGLGHSFTGISYAYLSGYDGQIYSVNPNCDKEKLANEYWIKSAANQEFWDIIIPTHNADYYNIFDSKSYMPVVSFVKKITWHGKSNFVSVIQIDLKYSVIKRIIESVDMGINSFMLILDESNKIIYCPDEMSLGKDAKNIVYKGTNIADLDNPASNRKDLNVFTIEYNIANTDWKLIGVISTDNMFTKLKEITDISLVIILISVAFSFLVSYILSKGITRPITRVIKRMKMVGEGQFDINIPETKNEDLKELSISFSKMVNQIELLMKDMIVKEKEKTRLELEALQTQINPHFLYNTLNTIKWMAIMEKPYQSLTNAIMCLGKILKYSYEGCDNFIRIRDEVDFLKNYIYIQRVRFGEEIQVKFEIDEMLYDFYILKFTLQPIIENSIIHGLAGKKDKGEIIIRGAAACDKLVLGVEDNGVGTGLSMKEMFTGLGINNVYTRIILNFGEEYGLNIESSLGIGTKVTITLPIINQEGGKS